MSLTRKESTQMHPSAPQSPPLQTLLNLINEVLSLVLASSLSVRSFIGRWQALHSKLSSLSSCLSSVSESPHWSENSLLHTLLPNLLSTLQRLKALSDQCMSQSFKGGKLLMQSDINMANAALSNQIHDLDLLLRSGVLHHSNAIVLSRPGPGSEKDDIGFFIRDLFTRLQIGGIEFKKKALESLLQILNDDDGKKSACLVVAKEGNIGYLVHLLDMHNYAFIREQAVSAVSLLLAAGNDESRKIVFEEGGLGPLLRILETGSTPLKEKAAIAVEAITADVENAWAVSAYGGISVLLEACRSGTPAIQSHAVGAIRNVAGVEDIKTALAEEGAVAVLVQLLVTGTTAAQEKAANCISVLASSGEFFRSLIIQERGLQRLMCLIQDLSSSDTLEHVLRAITSLSELDSVNRMLSCSTLFIVQLGELVKHGNVYLQHISISLLAKLTMTSDGNKRAIASCIPTVVKLMESPKPVGMQEAAMQALLSLLGVRSNRKDMVRDEKSVMRLMQMLDPKNEVVDKKYPVAVVATLCGCNGCRKRLVSVGAHNYLQRLAEMEVAGAKKALQRLAGNRLKNMFSRTWRE